MKPKSPCSKKHWLKRVLAWRDVSDNPLGVMVLISFIVFLSMLLSVFFLHIMIRLYPNDIAVIDLSRIQTTFFKQASHQTLSQFEMTQLSHRFAEALEHATHRVSAQYHGPLLVKGAVISGGHDVTARVEARIATLMQRLPEHRKSQRLQHRERP